MSATDKPTAWSMAVSIAAWIRRSSVVEAPESVLAEPLSDVQPRTTAATTSTATATAAAMTHRRRFDGGAGASDGAVAGSVATSTAPPFANGRPQLAPYDSRRAGVRRAPPDARPSCEHLESPPASRGARGRDSRSSEVDQLLVGGFDAVAQVAWIGDRHGVDVHGDGELAGVGHRREVERRTGEVPELVAVQHLRPGD